MRARTPALLVTTLLVSLATVAAASPAPAQDARIVRYGPGGHEVRLGSPDGLASTAAPFRRLVHHRLRHLWELTGGTERCRTAPAVIVATWMSTGYARAGEGIYAPCPGGGYDQIYLRRDGHWRAPKALASQEIRSCSLLRWYRVPRPVADRTCWTDQGSTARYRTYRLPADYSTGDYAARMLAAYYSGGHGMAPAWWATPDAVQQLDALTRRADTVTVARCFGPDDPEHGADLQGAPRGCLLDATKDGQPVARGLLRLYPAKLGRWQARSVQALA